MRCFSALFDQSTTFSLDDLPRSEDASWSNYIRGVADILQGEGQALRGMNLVVTGTVPMGSGLSSSAAMETAACLAFETAAGFDLDPVNRALLCQRAEREYVGVNSGIMDQFISCLGQAGHALFIDTRSLEYEAAPLPSGVSIVVSDTNKTRGLVDSKYNQRRAECEEAVRLLQARRPEITALRDVSVEDFRRLESLLPEPVRRRARHVVTENERVIDAKLALNDGDIAGFGVLMDESHESLRYDYQVSCRELDALVQAARTVPGVFGSRMTGAGFGGSTVSMVAIGAVEEFKRTVAAKYTEATGMKSTIRVCQASDGARRIS